MEKEQKEKLEKFLLTADELKKWLMDNGLDYIGGKIIERVCFSITKGKTYLCRKDVVMDSGEVAYREGVLYHSEEDGCLTDEQGTVGHVWTDGYAEYFVPYGAFEAGEWLWDDILRIPLRVDGVHSATYRLTDNTGKSYFQPKCDVEAVYHKWDVMKDAERGDILVGEDGKLLIFHEKVHVGRNLASCSCIIGNDNIPQFIIMWYNPSFLRPATNKEEERAKKALFSRGYVIDEKGAIVPDKSEATEAKMEVQKEEPCVKEVSNLDGMYFYKNTLNNGITLSLKTSSEGETMEIVGMSPSQRESLCSIIECFAKE